MNTHFEEATLTLQVWSHNATPLLSRQVTSIFTAVPIIIDPAFRSLTADGQANDAPTGLLLTKLCVVILGVIERQLATQLPGGEFWNPDEELRTAAESCSSTNISGERVFARVDQEMAPRWPRAPGASHGYIDAKVMFKTNTTGDWLMEQEGGSMAQHIRDAMKEARDIRVEERAQEETL